MIKPATIIFGGRVGGGGRDGNLHLLEYFAINIIKYIKNISREVFNSKHPSTINKLHADLKIIGLWSNQISAYPYTDKNVKRSIENEN